MKPITGTARYAIFTWQPAGRFIPAMTVINGLVFEHRYGALTDAYVYQTAARFPEGR